MLTIFHTRDYHSSKEKQNKIDWWKSREHEPQCPVPGCANGHHGVRQSDSHGS